MRKAKGVSLVYMIVLMTVTCMIASLAVDLARVQLAKTEMRRAADSAARAGAAGLATDVVTALNNANYYANHNYVDGSTLSLIGNGNATNSDIQIGTWSSSAHKFTQLFGDDRLNGNAVRIAAHRGSDRGNAIPIFFAAVKGFRACQVNAEAIATFTPVNVSDNVPGTANPFLAGMPKGSTASSNNNPSGRHTYDYAGDSANPMQSPVVSGLPVSSGADFTFDTISGTVKHDPSLPEYQPDGQLDDIGHNNTTPDWNNNYSSTYMPQNGISDIKAPIDALVGVFLDDNAPDKSPLPSIDVDNCPQDYSTAAARNKTEYRPALKQLFFIGDGKTDGGVPQNFIAPKGATRLFLATWDFYEWRNNDGNRTIKVNRSPIINLVK